MVCWVPSGVLPDQVPAQTGQHERTSCPALFHAGYTGAAVDTHFADLKGE
jgi:hypothetical protein